MFGGWMGVCFNNRGRVGRTDLTVMPPGAPHAGGELEPVMDGSLCVRAR
jgi:hypothetical protein